MQLEVLEILSPGLGTTLQDRGRAGWRRFGVPRGGAMDDHAAAWANRLLDNPFNAPVLELLLQGARLRLLQKAWVAITGADAEANVPLWHANRLDAGDVLEFPRNRSGVWTYVAVEGGFEGQRWLGSVSAYPRGRLGQSCRAGTILQRSSGPICELPVGIAGRWLSPSERRQYDTTPTLRVWPAPQWRLFDEAVRKSFFDQDWTVTGRSDRVGYRLSGQRLEAGISEIISEANRVGTIQVPENGQPIITMRDGPTVGGYPKLGLIDPADLAWLAQCRPGQRIRCVPIDETRPQL